ncbi:hypothetical protein [Mycolicibacterium porcinum]|nr:hypothetical protein [Mycolicibacterium porcinum]
MRAPGPTPDQDPRYAAKIAAARASLDRATEQARQEAAREERGST